MNHPFWVPPDYGNPHFWHQAESRQGGFPLATPASTAGWNFGEDLAGAVGAVTFWEPRNLGKSPGDRQITR